jgi:hypothetical protein
VPFYCEENVYHLASAPLLTARSREVVFISNARRACAVWHQRAARRPTWPILWDYHVVLLCARPWEVWDLDSTLGFPCPAVHYLERSFRREAGEDLAPRFRVVDADLYLERFASDRSHMRARDGSYAKDPPPWRPIGAPGAPSNLASFVDMRSPFLGEVMDLRALLVRIADA